MSIILVVAAVQLLSCVQLFGTQWTEARQASLSFTVSWSLLKLMSIKLVMPLNHLILCHPLLLMPSIFPSITVFSNEVAKVCLISIVSLSVYLHLSVYPSVICLCIIISVCLHIQPSI